MTSFGVNKRNGKYFSRINFKASIQAIELVSLKVETSYRGKGNSRDKDATELQRPLCYIYFV